MDITLVSHASVVIETSDCVLWTDPWLEGKAFNDSWSLIVPSQLDARLLRRVHFIWISHEHPDHFHVPTLRSLPSSVRQNVVVLFQENNSEKMRCAFMRMGFSHFRKLPHRKSLSLTRETSVYCYQVGQMDSVLGVSAGGRVVLNVNDAEVNTRDCRLIRRDLAYEQCDLVLNQFSLAGYDGRIENRALHLERQAGRVLSNLVSNHKDLHANATLPFASFIYFSCEDNRYVNRYANSPRNAYVTLRNAGLDCIVLLPGERYRLGEEHDSREALAHYDKIWADVDALQYASANKVAISEIKEAFDRFHLSLLDHFPSIVLRVLQPLVIKIPDLGVTLRVDLGRGQLAEVDGDKVDAELIVGSQPLHFAFSTPFGFQTLGVSARYELRTSAQNKWRWYRIVSSLNNAEIYLRPTKFFRVENVRFIMRRLHGGLNQVIYKLRRAFPS